ncbi:MAG: excisionase [Treponema sp.]|nr:excisionase [Treponema sp.]
MKYTLCHKDIPVIRFESYDGIIFKNPEILSEEHVMPCCFDRNGKFSMDDFKEWWLDRAVPLSRKNIRERLHFLNVLSNRSLIAKSMGLSLSDHYWMKTERQEDLSWHEVNFFENEFSGTVGDILFGNHPDAPVSEKDWSSPDITLNGYLNKKWFIDEKGTRVMMKGCSSPQQQEPFNEVLGSLVCGRLGIEHVPYRIMNANGDFYSACPCLTTKDVELVPAWSVIATRRKSNSASYFDHLLDCCRESGMKDTDKIRDGIGNMIAMDFIISNVDRHYNNFGFLRNSGTLEWLGLAPVFDCDHSMFKENCMYDFKIMNPFSSKYTSAKPFATRQYEQLKRIACRCDLSRLNTEKLAGIEDDLYALLSENPRIEEEPRDILCSILKSRVREFERRVEKG